MPQQEPEDLNLTSEDIDYLFDLASRRATHAELLSVVEQDPTTASTWLDVVNNQGMTLFGVLVQSGDVELVERLIRSYSPTLDATDERMQTPLMYSCRMRHVSIALLLIEEGALVDKVDDYGNSALFFAVSEYKYAPSVHLPLIVRLLALGAPADYKNNYGRSPRDLVALSGDEPLVRAFSKH